MNTYSAKENDLLSKYLTLNTSEPPSLAAPNNLGLWISVKSFWRRNSLNNWQTPDWILKIAWFAGVCEMSSLRMKKTYSEV